MPLSKKFVKAQLPWVKPLVADGSLEFCRRGQERLGQILMLIRRKSVVFERVDTDLMDAFWAIPKQCKHDGVILYLHGGGYCGGDKQYTRGTSALFAEKCGVRVFSVAYRLAPEHPFPSAVDDAVLAYRYLLRQGYSAKQIVLAGESAGGGLCYALSVRLKSENLPQAAGIIVISPWTDLTLSGESYQKNREKDPYLTVEVLKAYAKNYTDEPTHPQASPLFADLSGLPKSLIFVGGDEIMIDDSYRLHEKLQNQGGESELVVAEGLWHVYVLFDLKERQEDYAKMDAFLDGILPPFKRLRWLKLDNSAKIYPASRSRNWSNIFRLSANMSEDVDVDVLQSALAVTVRRFPSIAVRLCTGMFWYYLEEIAQPPKIEQDISIPTRRMSRRRIKNCAFRVLVYRNRIAVEFFHSLTDGNGGLVFLKTLIAEYVEQRYGVKVSVGNGVLDRAEQPSDEEFEDSFLKYAGKKGMSRREADAFELKGTKEAFGFVHDLAFTAKVADVKREAKRHNVSITVFLCAVMMKAFLNIQARQIPSYKKRRPVKMMVPVNLRNLYPSKSLRNFVLYINPGIDGALGDYTVDEICKSVHHQMGYEITPKRMGARIKTNVASEESLLLKLAPLFLKNIAMKAVYNAVGERKFCCSMSNLGAVKLPDELLPYVKRFDFILSPPSSRPNSGSAISYGDELVINFVRNIEEPTFEAEFHRVMMENGVRMKVESNSEGRENYDLPTRREE